LAGSLIKLNALNVGIGLLDKMLDNNILLVIYLHIRDGYEYANKNLKVQ